MRSPLYVWCPTNNCCRQMVHLGVSCLLLRSTGGGMQAGLSRQSFTCWLREPQPPGKRIFVVVVSAAGSRCCSGRHAGRAVTATFYLLASRASATRQKDFRCSCSSGRNSRCCFGRHAGRPVTAVFYLLASRASATRQKDFRCSCFGDWFFLLFRRLRLSKPDSVYFALFAAKCIFSKN